MDKNNALQKLLDGNASEEETQLLRQLLASGEISIGGNVIDSNVVNGNENIVISNKEGTINVYVSADKASMLRGLAQDENRAIVNIEAEKLLGIIKNYQEAISVEMESRAAREDWSMSNFIREEARFLPVNASPYHPDSLHGKAVDLIQQLDKNKKTLVLGEPGSGKSVALERFAWVLASNEGIGIPFIYRLADFQGDSLLDRVRSELFTANLISVATIEHQHPPLKDLRLYVLLDGLNEVQGDESRRLVKEIRDIQNQFPMVRLVITSRIQDEGWRSLQSSGSFETMVIQPLRLEDAKVYLENQLGKEAAANLWDSLDSNLKEIMRTPLILHLVKGLAHRQEQNVQMPRNRGELYEEFVRRRFFIDRVNKAQERRAWHDLEQLALTMQLQSVNKLNIDEEHLFDVIKDDQRIQVIRSSGFIIGEGRGIRFPHQTFQEFFVARAIRHIFKKYLVYTPDKDWTEIFVFLSGLIDPADKLIQAIYKKNVWLAWWCILEGNSITEETRNYVETRSNGLIHSPLVEDRRAAAEVLAGMQLARSIPLLITLVQDDNAEVSIIARTGLKNLSKIIEDELYNEFYKPTLTDYQRVQLGEALGVTRDIRPGVIVLSTEDTPLIDWVDVPGGANETGISIPAFRMSRYIITNSLFENFLNDKDGGALERWWTESGKRYRQFPRSLPARFVDSDFILPNHPAIYVSWFEASAFCAWISDKLGYAVRLPTEAEWMRTACANSEVEHSLNTNVNILNAGYRKTTPVGSFLNCRSPFGALDMAGNTFCWCQTKWREDLCETEDNDPEGAAPRVMRGGSFTHTLSIDRLGDFPFGRHYFVGFRVVCSGGENG